MFNVELLKSYAICLPSNLNDKASPASYPVNQIKLNFQKKTDFTVQLKPVKPVKMCPRASILIVISNSKWEKREREKVNFAKIYLLLPLQFCLSQISSFAT